MEMARLGRTGLKVETRLGTMTYGDPKLRRRADGEGEDCSFFKAAIEAGINFFRHRRHLFCRRQR